VALRQGEPPSQHVAIIGLNRSSMNTKDVVTATLDSINVMTAGVLKKKDGAAIQFEPLLQSSADSELLPVMRLAFLPDSQSLLEDFKPTGERYVVAARIHGKLKSAFPNGAPAAEGADAAKPAGEHKTESVGDANLIVVADAPTCSPNRCGCGRRTCSVSTTRWLGRTTVTSSPTRWTTSRAAGISSASAAVRASSGRSPRWTSCASTRTSSCSPRKRSSTPS
jgi:hypothetical protein